MAETQTYRLYFVTLPDGRVRITDHNPGNQFKVIPWELIGPPGFELPDLPQTQTEHDAWVCDLLESGLYGLRANQTTDIDWPEKREQ